MSKLTVPEASIRALYWTPDNDDSWTQNNTPKCLFFPLLSSLPIQPSVSGPRLSVHLSVCRHVACLAAPSGPSVLLSACLSPVLMTSDDRHAGLQDEPEGDFSLQEWTSIALMLHSIYSTVLSIPWDSFKESKGVSMEMKVKNRRSSPTRHPLHHP